MSFFSRRPSVAGSPRISTRSLIRWLTTSMLAGSSLSAALPARTSQPYLAAISPLPLRLAPPPPDLSTEPVPAAPPNPDGIVGEVAQINHEAVAPTPALPLEDTVTVTVAPETPTAPAPAETPASRPPVEILPDDLNPPVSPEDVLPFFLPPQLPTGPQSQATYRQK